MPHYAIAADDDFRFRGRCSEAMNRIDEILRQGGGMSRQKEIHQLKVWELLQEGFQRGFARHEGPEPVISGWWAFARKAYNNPSSSGVRRRAQDTAGFIVRGDSVSENDLVLLREFFKHTSRMGDFLNVWRDNHPLEYQRVLTYKATYEGGQPQQQTDNQEASSEEMFLKAQAARTIDGWVGQVHKYDNSGFQGESLIVWQGEPIPEDSGPTEEKKTTQQLAIDEAEAKINEVVAKLFQS